MVFFVENRRTGRLGSRRVSDADWVDYDHRGSSANGVSRGADGMSPRLIILIVLAGGMAVYLATRTTAPAEEPLARIGADAHPLNETDDATVPLEDRPLEGEEPSERAEFDVRVEVDPSGRKTRLFFYITEKHGYYVESPNLTLWHIAEPGLELYDTNLRIRYIINDFIRANETYKGCVDVVPAELVRVGDDIGTDENWAAHVESWGRTRLENPDPFPAVVHAMSCE